MGNNITPLQWIGIGVLGVLAVAVAWQWGMFGGGANADATEFARIEAYARADDPEALVREITANKDVKRVCRSVRTMGRLGSIAIKGIRVAMIDERPAVREAAMIAVSKAGTEKDTPVIATAAIDDKSPEVRAAAVLSLGRMGAYTEIETLLRAMNDENEIVRRRAEYAITEIIGAGVDFNPAAAEPERVRAIAELRTMWLSMKSKTEEFYQNRKRYRELHPNKS